ncbi:MAG: orotate phosphoribosyltransferase-like protein [Candidatus Hydrothermarchaeales archaeon]
MRNITELIKKAHELKEKGFSTGEISDELNVSRETALWLVTHKRKKKEEEMPTDIYIDWSTIGTSSARLEYTASAMSDLIIETLEEKELEEPDVIVGIATSGIPIATLIAAEWGVALAIVRPKKHLWEPEKEEKQAGYLLTNFADVKGRNVVLVDDIVTTGTTIKETITLLKEAGAKPLAAVVLIDKKGISNVEGIPVRALVEARIVEELG